MLPAVLARQGEQAAAEVDILVALRMHRPAIGAEQFAKEVQVRVVREIGIEDQRADQRKL